MGAAATSPRFHTITTEEWLAEPCGDSYDKDIKLIFSDSSEKLGMDIGQLIATYSGKNIEDICCDIDAGKFSNGETRVKICCNIRNKHVIIVGQIRTGYINDDLMELFLILDACNRSDVRKKTVVMPYLPYSRSDKKDEPRTPIGSALLMNILSGLGIDNLISLDLHSGQLQGLLPKGFHNLYMKNYMCDFIHNNYLKGISKETWNDRFILVAPDAGSSKMIRSYSKTLGINNVVMDKARDYSTPSTVMQSRIIGDVSQLIGKTGLIVDDMADTMGTMTAAASELIEFGLKDIVIFVTHGILSGKAIEKINQNPHIREIVVTDSLPQDDNISKSSKIRVVSCVELVTRTLDGIMSWRSVSKLFEN